METFWYIALTFMMIMYVILDGFDLGAGIIHLKAAKTDDERRGIINSIGPIWDGNEVWLIAAGGTLFFVFPAFYAAVFSGFYLPLIIILWLLIGRAIGIELRKHLENPLWRTFWDAIFFFSSFLLAIFYGAALGNLIRGVPLGADAYFFEPLWTNFLVSQKIGILDWFTVIMGMVSLNTLTAHGANYIALRTDGLMQIRARSISTFTSWGALVFSIAAIVSVFFIRPGLFDNFLNYPVGSIFILLSLAGIFGMLYYRYRINDRNAFLSSALFISGMLGATSFGLFPYLLTSITNKDYSLTVYNSKAGDYGMNIGLFWWIPGIILAILYFIYLFYHFRGKIKLNSEEEGY